MCYVDLLLHESHEQPPLRCNCLPQWSGERCETPVNVCEGRCHNGGTCYTTRAGLPVCNCKSEFSGHRCQICAKLECLNGGVCSKANGEEKCACPDGYEGLKCEIESCNFSCGDHGTCITDANLKPYCKCVHGYSGQRCEHDACYNHCLNGGSCKIGVKQPECICPPFYSGRRCEIDLCKNNSLSINCTDCKCAHNGSCVNHGEVKVCKCTDTWGGDKCQVCLINFR